MSVLNNFISNPRHSTWKIILDLYPKVLKIKAEKKTKKSATKELLALDKWYQEDLCKEFDRMKDPHMTTAQLVKLMKWKLSRGKFRPRLIEFAESNEDATVQRTTSDAYGKLKKGQLRESVETLCKLKGIGPATASAILTALCPSKAAFMADEPTTALLGQSSLKYNASEYLTYMERVNTVMEELNKEDDCQSWIPHTVEIALWTYCVAKQLQPELLQELNKPETVKRKAKTDTESPLTKRKR